MNAHDKSMVGVRAEIDRNDRIGEPRTGERRFWTAREVSILKKTYPVAGIAGCLAALPGRSASSIYQKAGAYGLRRPTASGKIVDRQEWPTSDAIDEKIVRTYQSTPTNGAIKALALSVNRPRWWVSKRARHLGLVTPRFKEAPWSEDEIAILERSAHLQPEVIARRLKKAGFHRSDTAVVVKLKRLELDRTDPDRFTQRELARAMGVDDSTINRWIERLGLKATKRRCGDRPDGKRDLWSIHRRDIAAFIIENLAHVDIRKVDKFWFVDLLTHDGRQARKKQKEADHGHS